MGHEPDGWPAPAQDDKPVLPGRASLKQSDTILYPNVSMEN